MVNKKMMELGKERSVIRELFEMGKLMKAERGEGNVFDFTIGNPTAPTPQELNGKLAELIYDKGVHSYTSAAGDGVFRQEIAKHLHKTWGVSVRSEDVYVTCGAAAALCIALNAVICCGDEVIVVAPYFPEYKVFIEKAGGKTVVVESREDFDLSVSAIADAVTERTCAVIINTPNNPTGRIYSDERLKELADALTQKQEELGRAIYLISDEPYREVVYDRPFACPMKHYANTVTCYSFSKTLSLAGERIGYLALREDATDRDELFCAVCGAGRSLGYVCAPSIFQHAIKDCMGSFSDTSSYLKNRNLLLQHLTALNFECVKPEGAFYLFVKCPAGSREFFDACLSEGILVVPSDGFGLSGYVRISYCVEEETVTRALQHFTSVAKKLGLI